MLQRAHALLVTPPLQLVQSREDQGLKHPCRAGRPEGKEGSRPAAHPSWAGAGPEAAKGEQGEARGPAGWRAWFSEKPEQELQASSGKGRSHGSGIFAVLGGAWG